MTRGIGTTEHLRGVVREYIADHRRAEQPTTLAGCLARAATIMGRPLVALEVEHISRTFQELDELNRPHPSGRRFRTPALAAKAFAAKTGRARGGAGGWIYSTTGKTIVQGWHAYGWMLVQRGIVSQHERRHTDGTVERYYTITLDGT